jgi:triphosphatase
VVGTPTQPAARGTGAEPGAAGRNAEIELKLLAEPDALARLHEAPVVTRHARNGGVVRRLDAVYYDTPDRTLYRNGLSLRVRRSGSRYIQTLKRVLPDGGNFARQEWECPVETVAPDLGRLPAAELGDTIDPAAARALVPVFTTKVRRRTRRLDLAEAEVEIAFDEGTIEAGDRREPLSEVELELKRGDVGVLYDIGAELLDIAPLRVGTVSKADRGYGLAFDEPPRETRAGQSGVNADHAVDDAIAIVLGETRQQVLANQAVAEDGRNLEGVHQMRVALRRLRTGFSIFRRALALPTLAAFNEEAKRVSEKLGRARNWDVFVSETLADPAAACSGVDFGRLRAAAEPHRAAAYADLRAALRDPAYNRFQLALGHWIERRGWRNEVPPGGLAALSEPVSALAARMLDRLYKKALKQGAHFRHLPAPSRHRLRITLKKLRYTAEFFAGVYGDHGGAGRWLGRLSKLQNALGRDHDAASLPELLAAIEAGAPGDVQLQRPVGALLGWSARDGFAAAETLEERWRKFRHAPGYWSG